MITNQKRRLAGFLFPWGAILMALASLSGCANGGVGGSSAVTGTAAHIEGHVLGGSGSIGIKIRWPTVTRLIGLETRRIDLSIIGSGIADPSPYAMSLLYPATEVQLTAPSGKQRFLKFQEFEDAAGLIPVKSGYVLLGDLSPDSNLYNLNFYFDDQNFAQNLTMGTAAALPGEGSLSPLMVIDTEHSVALSGPARYGTQEWWYFDVAAPATCRVQVTHIEQIALADPHFRVRLAMTGGDGVPITAGLTAAHIAVNPVTGASAQDVSDLEVSADLQPGRFWVHVDVCDTSAIPMTQVLSGANHFGYRIAILQKPL